MIGVRFFCVCRVLFSTNTFADFCSLRNFGVLLRDLAVVAQKTINYPILKLRHLNSTATSKV